jgi:hypothetical protein
MGLEAVPDVRQRALDVVQAVRGYVEALRR